MKSIFFRAGMGLFIFALSCASVWAQATAQISGTVKDQTGAVLPGVDVTATQSDTGVSRNTVTNETGSYVLPNLPVGPYRLEAALPGFRTFIQTGIVLQVNATPVVNPVLEVGQVSEQVEVQANAALVETQSVGIGQVVEQQRILELPLDGRNLQDLVTLNGAAVVAATTTGRLGSGQLISIGGGVPFGTDYSLDGANHMNFLSGAPMPMPFPDAAQEFKTESTGLTANRGNSSSVAVVTKSGTNEFHGDLFEFVRNDLFNATSYFAAVDPTTGDKVGSSLKRNQFGGTFGGPVVKDKVFFFGGFQGTTLRADAADTQNFVPTPGMLSGDWTAFTSAGCNGGRTRTLKAPFSNNHIDPALYSKVALYVTNKVLESIPTQPNECGLVTGGSPTHSNEQFYVAKVDYQKSAQHSMFGRVILNHLYNPDSSKLTSSMLVASNGQDSLASSYAFGDTYLIGSNMVQAFRLAVNRNANHQYAKQYFSVCDAGATDIYCGYTPEWISGFTITGGFGGLGVGIPTGTYWIPTQYQLNDDVTMVRGNHQYGMGIAATHGRINQQANFLSGGSFRFTGTFTGLGMGDFMTGKVATFQQGTPNKLEIREKRINLYVTDTWKLTPRLTANYGIRWEPFLPQVIPNNGTGLPGPVYNFNHDRFIQGIYSSVFLNAPAGFYYTGDPGFPAKTGINAAYDHFAPRLGLAWDVKGDGKTSVRASYAYGYAFLSGIWREDASGSIPWGGRVSVESPPGGLDAPWKGLGNPFPYVLDQNAPFLPKGLFLTNKPDLTTPHIYSWNLAVQRQIGSNWVVSASYLATRGQHIWTENSINPAIFLGLGPCTLSGVSYTVCSSTTNTDARRLLTLERPADGAKIGPLSEYDDGATSIYHGMLLSVERRAGRGVTFTGNYTWSHCITEYADINSSGPPANETYSKPGDRNFDRGNCLADRRQLFNFTTVAQTPEFSNHRVNMLASGWKASGIYRWSSGAPINVVSGIDNALTGTIYQRANQILPDAYLDTSGRPNTTFIDPAAFATPAFGTYGNVGWNSLHGPVLWSFDMSLSRSFNLRESQRVEVRAEAFNVTNSFIAGGLSGSSNVGAVTTGNTLGTNNPATFGQIRTARDPRVLQFALKYVF